MNVFLDTNILIDVIENREGTVFAKQLLQLGKDKKINIYASFLSFANINYIKRGVERTLRYNMIRRLRHSITVLNCEADQLDTALAHDDVRDFEDLLQYQCAVAGCCDVVVTNNKKDFLEFCELPLMSSREFLLYFFSHQQ